MSASKRKGTAWESAIVAYLIANGVPRAERRTLAGAKDRGDIAGIPGVVIEAKSATRIDLAGWLDETEAERRNDLASVGAAWIKRRGKASPGQGYVVMTGERFLRLLADAGYVPQPPLNDITPADPIDTTPGRPHRDEPPLDRDVVNVHLPAHDIPA
ncbi:hypothetical protein OG271_03860 [Micromonospora rifamycinica]|uniref:hypothetical protein n=1 Tax=Micromonospora rifamycinica TaxID=291594 RepID=UPI002E2B7024|nr:hypothetical protein [Micromonospora rifamycinica]